MPRAGWLAAGALAAALVALAAPGNGLRLAPLLVTLGICVALAGRARGRPEPAWAGVGASLLATRLILGGLPGGPVSEPAALDPSASVHEATVVAVHAPGNGQQRAVVALVPLHSGERAWATLPRYPTLAPTDRLRLEGRLERAPEASESGFAEFLARTGVGWTIRARAIELLPGSATPAAALEGLRRDAARLIAQALPEPEAGLTAAMLIGLRDLVARDVTSDFRTSGLSHVVAISGFHMALLAAMAQALLRPISRRPRSIALVLIIAGYAVLAGASPGVLRAAVMSGVVIAARESGRRGQAGPALALTVLLLLLVEPQAVSDVGFQLSVAATAGLLRWGQPFAGGLRRWLPERSPTWLLEALGVSLAAQLATLPLVLLHFGRLSLVAPLANLLAAPVVAPSMAAGGAALLVGGLAGLGVPGEVLAPASLIATLTVGALVGVARICADLPLASVELAQPLDLLGAGGAASVVLLMLRQRPGRTHEVSVEQRHDDGERRRPPRRLALAALASVALLVVIVGAGRPDGRLHMTVLDVGQGDAILLRGPAGSRMLVDTGPDPDRLLAELDRRLPAWDRRLDMVVITHPHEDHVAGLALLLERYRIGAIAEPGMIGLGPGDAAFRRRLAELNRRTLLLAAGDRFSFDGVEAVVHWPIRGRVPPRPTDGGRDVNNVSIVLELRFGTQRLLLTGDVEQEVDGQLLAAGIAPVGGPPIDVLKVAHHGSGTASTDALVERLRPRLALISAGAGNRYGHPSPATVARLERAGAQLFRTDLDGSIEVIADGRTLTVDTSAGPRQVAAATQAEPGSAGAGFCPVPPPQPVTAWAAYNRWSGRPISRRGLSSAALARSARVAGRALDRRGRGGRLPRPRRGRAERREHRSPAGRGRRAAARPRQGAAR